MSAGRFNWPYKYSSFDSRSASSYFSRRVYNPLEQLTTPDTQKNDEDATVEEQEKLKREKAPKKKKKRKENKKNEMISRVNGCLAEKEQPNANGPRLCIFVVYSSDYIV